MSPILGVFSNLVTVWVKVLLPCTIFQHLLFDLVVQGILGREVVLSPIMPCLFNQAIDIDGDPAYTREWTAVTYLIQKNI